MFPLRLFLSVIFAVLLCANSQAQLPEVRHGDRVPSDAKVIYERGLHYLANTQNSNGSWGSTKNLSPFEEGQGAGITGMCLMAFLASGEDPDYGRYSRNTHAAVRSIILSQDPKTGYYRSGMYHHGFAMLAIAEAYGTMTESMVWKGDEPANQRRTLGESLELAVRCVTTSQKNNRQGGWRYGPRDNSADTSVSGAVLMGLLAARNAGIEVPDASIDRALNYFKSNTSNTGMVAYSGGLGGMGESMNRSAIATLVYSVGKKSDWKERKATLEHITSRLEHNERGYPCYFRYYMAQALFQGDFESWKKWNRQIITKFKETQNKDGSFRSDHGPAYGTSMSLLALGLNYRFLPVYER